jgi:hypothetical protein
MQYVRKFFYQFNGSHNGTLLEYCTSVFAEPTRGRVLDGMYGRANGSIMIAQPRRQRPGWDGCRDRADGNPHLPQVPHLAPIQAPIWASTTCFAQIPSCAPRPGAPGTAVHRAAGDVRPQGHVPRGHRRDHHVRRAGVPARAAAELQQSDVPHDHVGQHVVLRSVSVHQQLLVGRRVLVWLLPVLLRYVVDDCCCDVPPYLTPPHSLLSATGYYGVDCSNTSCAGTSCYYDPINWDQVPYLALSSAPFCVSLQPSDE